IMYMAKTSGARCRERISEQTGVPARNILISVTHTHSGPKMLDPIATSGDEMVAKTDPAVVRFIEERIIDCGCRAVENPRPAEAGLAVADAAGVGTNRRDPGGAKDLDVPLLMMRDAGTHRPLAAMLV